MNTGDEPWEIARDLTEKRYRSLATLRDLGGEARTTEVTSAAEGLYSQLLGEHYRLMDDAGLVEKIDEGPPDDSSPLPREGYKYRITDRGRDVLSAAQEDYGMSLPEERTVRRRFDRLEERVSGIEDSLQARSEAGDQDGRDGDLEERVASLESDFEDLVEDVGTVVERLEEVREEVGVSGL